MRSSRRALFSWTAGMLAGACARAPRTTRPRDGASSTVSKPRESLLIERARVHGRPDADAILIVGDAIAAVGPRTSIRPATGTRRLDAHGALVLPGFHDAHAHVRSGGLMLGQARLDGLDGLDEVVEAVRAFAGAHPSPEWVLGRGWSYDIVPRGRFPTRQDLDRVSSTRPILLESYDGHAVWANSAALSHAGIDAATADPPDGRIVRESDGRTPAGTLLEGAATLVEKIVPPPSEAEERAALARGLRHLASLGVTAVDDFERDAKSFERYAALRAEGELPARVWVSLPLDGPLDEYRALAERHDSMWLRFGYLKGFVDGVIESKTAYMLSPYQGSSSRGAPLLSPERLQALVRRATGFRVALHAIGDAAVRLSLDAFAQAGPPARGRHRVEHIEVVHPEDVPRFASLGVTASMQPYHAVPSDEPDRGVWSQNLGAERLRRAFAWRQLVAAGAPLAFGSDWPVMSADPLRGLAVALTRRNERGLPAQGWRAEHRLTLDEAIDAYTLGPARALGWEERAGSIAPTKQADLVVLAPGVRWEEPATLWRGAGIAHVVAGGRVVHSTG